MTHAMLKGGVCTRDADHPGQCNTVEAVARRREKARKQRAEDPSIRKYQQEYYWNNRERARQRQRKWELKQYGLTPDEYDLMVVAQAGRCAICNIETSELHVDHDHNRPGTHRELLCRHCNWMLGMAHDDPEILQAGIDYLENHKAV
jgi:hypothetical protein